MALPTSTTNLDTATINGIVYTYNSTKGAWYKQSTASTSVPVTISGTLSVSGNANVGNLGSPTVVNGNSNVTVTANSDVSIAANGAVRVTVAASGNVGVGTASPVGKLAVVGGYTQLSGGTTAQAGLRVQYASSVATVTGINHDNDAFNPISFYTGVTEAMRIDSNGNVGIGTSSPAAKLDLGSGNLNFSSTAQRITGDFSNATLANRVMFQNSTLNARTNISALPNGTNTNAGVDLFNSSSNTENASLFRIAITNAEYQLEGTRTGTGTYLPMTFYTNGSERMRIDASGRVTMPYQPCFWAYAGASNPTLTGTQAALVFNSATTNVGSHYSTGNGRFTAPVAGTYLFNWTIAQTGATGGPVAYLGKNGTAVSPGAIAYGTAYNTGSMNAIITLAASDYVQVLGQALNGTSPVIDMNWSSFSGHLIG